MSYYDPFQEDHDAIDKAMKFLMSVIVALLIIGSCKAKADDLSPGPGLIEQEMFAARAVIIYQRMKLGMSPQSANESVLHKCGWMTPENVMNVINTKMKRPDNYYELASDVGIIMEIACEDPSI